MSTHHVVFGCVLLVAVPAWITLAVLGWATSRTDGSTRFTFRLWAWISAGAYLSATFGMIADHPRWWEWAWAGAVYLCVYFRIQHWWRAVEAARRIERGVWGRKS